VLEFNRFLNSIVFEFLPRAKPKGVRGNSFEWPAGNLAEETPGNLARPRKIQPLVSELLRNQAKFA